MRRKTEKESRKKPELLLPAKGMEEFYTAVNYGADAVYIGGEAYSLRARAKNFTLSRMGQAIDYAHSRGVRVYVTANIFAHDSDLEGAGNYFEELKRLKPDGLLISDPGLFSLARKLVYPEIPLHISTQANSTNHLTLRFWADMGASRVVCARELSLDEIAGMKQQAGDEVELEAFIHGAMCVSYSGRCLLSSYLTGRDANRGECTHPCRWKYALMEEKRPGEYLPVEENERGTYIFNSKDLCMVEHVPDLIRAGIDSWKIEGRMKTALYVAVTARTYRRAIDDFFESEEKYLSNIDWYISEISRCTTRDFTTGFFYHRPDETSQIYDGSTYNRNYVYLGLVEEADSEGWISLHQKNKFSTGEILEIMKKDGGNVEAEVERILDEEGRERDSAPHPGEYLKVKLSEEAEAFDILRIHRQTAT